MTLKIGKIQRKTYLYGSTMKSRNRQKNKKSISETDYVIRINIKIDNKKESSLYR